MAPGRFGAAINQAPMRRRTHGQLLRLFDLAANAVATLCRVRAIPPDQLLRQVFENLPRLWRGEARCWRGRRSRGR